MTTSQLASWNRNGLNGPVKCAACLDLLHRNHIDIAFIQESHLKATDVQRFANRQLNVAASVSVDSKIHGSLIVLKHSLSITILDQFGSEDGHISYIKTIIAGCKLAFMSVYAPNQFNLIYNVPVCIQIVLEVFEELSTLSGYKINWTKPSLMPLNSSLHTSTLPTHIPVAGSFKYLGVDVFPSLSISRKHFQGIMKQVKGDLERCAGLQNS